MESERDDVAIYCAVDDIMIATTCVTVTGLSGLGIPDGTHKPLCERHGNMSKHLAAESASTREIAERNGFAVASVSYDFHDPHEET